MYRQGSVPSQYKWAQMELMKEISQIRLENARALADSVGGTGEFAARIDREPTQASRFMGRNPTKKIGDRMARHIEGKFGKPIGWLDTDHSRPPSSGNVADFRARRKSPDSNAEMLEAELIEGDEPLRPDEVWLPMFREVEFAAGDGATQVIENHGAQERFSLPRLARAGVQPENAALAVAKGDSMMPAIHDGATLGIDKGCRHIIDGKVYVLDHGGMLRVKRLYRLPLNRVRVVSENSDEYPEETYSLSDPDAPRIIGKVFWWENFD